MNHPRLDPREAWNAGADAFVHFVDSGTDYYRHLVHGPALLKACGEVRGAAVLDVGCGHGYFSRLLARAGAAVTALDISDKLLGAAIEREAAEPQGITFRQGDAFRIGELFESDSFDLITGCMSIQDVSDPGAVLAGAARIIKPDGRVVFSVPHPCTDPPVREWKRDEHGNKVALCLDRYFESGPAVCEWNMRRLKYPWRTPFHRLRLTEWSGLIRDAGFVIRGLNEPRPSAKLVAEHPELDDCSRMPFFLIFEIIKQKG